MILRQAKQKIARQVANAAAKALHAGKPVNAIAFEPSAELAGELAKPLTDAFSQGRVQARAEDHRLMMQHNQQHLADDKKKKAVLPAPAETPVLVAKIAIEDVTADAAQAARKAALDLAREQIKFGEKPVGEIADLLFGAIDDAVYVDAGIEKAALEATHSAFNAGRAEGLKEGGKILDVAAFSYEVIRVAMLEAPSPPCGPCAAADGMPWERGKALGVICEGQTLCRCILVRIKNRLAA